MTPFLWFCLIFQLPETDPEIIGLVKSKYLDTSWRETVGKAFDEYPWFEEVRWSVERGREGVRVLFEGIIPDEAAIRDFEERHKYKFRSNFKAFQLKAEYGLEEGREKLSFLIQFSVNPDQSFQVEKGWLGILKSSGTPWRRVRLKDKALLFVIKGFYADRDPYMSLVRGLSYQ